LLWMEGCAGVLGRSYYVEGPMVDVTGRPHLDEGVLACLADMGCMPDERLCALGALASVNKLIDVVQMDPIAFGRRTDKSTSTEVGSP